MTRTQQCTDKGAEKKITDNSFHHSVLKRQRRKYTEAYVNFNDLTGTITYRMLFFTAVLVTVMATVHSQCPFATKTPIEPSSKNFNQDDNIDKVHNSFFR